MPTVMDILSGKGSRIHSIAPDVTVLEATKYMNEHKIGALVVMKGEQVVGVFTERDVLRRVVAEQVHPADITVGEVMTTDVICCEPTLDIEDVSRIMRDRRVRHLPVCGPDGQIVGMISIGDVNACYASTQEQTIHFLQDYIYGRA